MIDLNYIEPVFRPPSEWRSLILQVTNGCSWNKCTFCEMYQDPQKGFNFKAIEDIEQELQYTRSIKLPVNRIFLADGDAMTLSSRRLTNILKLIQDYYPQLQRVSAYCLPRNLKNKTVTELTALRELGLKMVYVGCESGDDEVLRMVDKGETYDSSYEALAKLKAAGIKTSVMILNGLGGVSLSKQHADNSAALMNESQPDYLSTLVVSFPKGDARFKSVFSDFTPMSQAQMFKELYAFINNLRLDKTIFRSDHASNALALKGVLNKDKERLLMTLDLAINQPESVFLRPESMRGL